MGDCFATLAMADRKSGFEGERGHIFNCIIIQRKAVGEGHLTSSRRICGRDARDVGAGGGRGIRGQLERGGRMIIRPYGCAGAM